MDITDGRRNSGVGGTAQKLWKRKNVRRFVALLCLVLAITFIVSIISMYKRQQKDLEKIAAEREEYIKTIEELSRERERLDSKAEYINSNEGLLQYARENLGYIYPDDIRLEGNDGE